MGRLMGRLGERRTPAWRLRDAATVRALIAARWLAVRGDEAHPGATLGEIVLRPHQRAAVARVRHALDEFGGALLADATGLDEGCVSRWVLHGHGHLLTTSIDSGHRGAFGSIAVAIEHLARRGVDA